MTSPNFGTNIPIHFPADAPLELIEKSNLLQNWIKLITDPQIKINEIKVITVDLFGKRVGFLEIEVNYTVNGIHDKERILLSEISCMISLILHAVDTNENFTILVFQPRIGCGKIMYEFPAGGTDGSPDYIGSAARELSEEVGIQCTADEMIHLSKLSNPKQPCNFLNYHRFDKLMYFYLVIKNLTKAEIMEYEGKQRGADEDEQITLHVLPFEDSWKYANEPASLSAYYMIQELIKQNKILYKQ